jgi:PAS domain S-box-containing protein/putative nucleotidyltransferase with HDIG domain
MSRQTKDDIVPNLMLIGAVTLAVMLFMAVAMITIMLITTRHILASVNCLKDGAEQIASGKLGFQVEQAGNDEIATLATAINQMSLDLMDSYRNLHEKTVQLEIEMSERQIIHEALEIKTVELEKEIEERRQAENALRESEEIFRRFMEYSPIYVFFKDDNMRALKLSNNFETMLGKPLVELLGKNMDDLFPSELAKSMVADDMRIMKEGKAITVEEGLNGRFYSTIKFPIVIEGKPRYLAGYTIDITERKQAEMRLINTLDSLRKAVGATIQVMVSAVEARDPYTSGHQIRTADLARSIAMEMGLPQEKIEGIRMAGSIHDIGKLSIPAEILSKPTKLSDIEFSLIKEHARKGFEMLKDVESPWPLAEIVHQHHERMDGSGYPKNLKGEEICIEARILAVSDVVESMASHRPYRAGLGIDLALAEIEKHKGIYYDDAVADACLRLFREKSYTLEGT